MALDSRAQQHAPPWEATAPPATTCPARAFALHGPAFEADPLGRYEAMRRHGSVVPVRLTEDGTFWGWMVLGYNEVLTVLHNREGVFSHDSRHWNAPLRGQLADHPMMRMIRYRDNVLSTDGPAHERLMAPLSASLERLNYRHVNAHIESICDNLLAGFAHTGRADLMRQYANIVPVQVMVELLGIAEADAQEVMYTTAMLLGEVPEAHGPVARLDELIAQLVRDKQMRPGPDLMSWMLSHGRELHTKEHNDQAWVMLAAGLGGCTAWMSLTLLKLLEDPALHQQIRYGSYDVADAANAAMWKHSPIQNVFGRWALKDTVLGGTRIRQGDLIIPSFHAANADPVVRPSHSVSLENRAHLSWGSGEHTCPGRNLGTAIVITAVERLIQRLPDLKLAAAAGDLAWAPTLVVRTLRQLPVEFTPVRVPPRAAPVSAIPPRANDTPTMLLPPVPPEPAAVPKRHRRSRTGFRRGR